MSKEFVVHIAYDRNADLDNPEEVANQFVINRLHEVEQIQNDKPEEVVETDSTFTSPTSAEQSTDVTLEFSGVDLIRKEDLANALIWNDTNDRQQITDIHITKM